MKKSGLEIDVAITLEAECCRSSFQTQARPLHAMLSAVVTMHSDS